MLIKMFRQKRDSQLRVYVCEACCEMGSFEETVCVISCCYTVRPLLAFTVMLSKCHLSDKTEKHSWIIMHSYRINKWTTSLLDVFLIFYMYSGHYRAQQWDFKLQVSYWVLTLLKFIIMLHVLIYLANIHI